MYNEKLTELLNEVKSIFNDIHNKSDLEKIKNEYLGKNGKITQANSLIREIPNDEKKEFGMKINEIKTILIMNMKKLVKN